MDLIKEILRKTLKGEYKVPKTYRWSDVDSPYSIYVEYEDLVVIRAHNGYNKIKYKDINLESEDRELSQLIVEVEKYVLNEKVKKEEFDNIPIGEIFTLGNKKFIIENDINCNSCYFDGFNCSKMMKDEIIPRCSKRKDNKTIIFKEVK